MNEPSACGDNYTVYFRKIVDEWCIVDVYSEEHAVYHLTAEEFDCAEAITQYEMAKTSEKNLDVEVIIAGDDMYESRAIPGLTLGGNNRREYFPDNAIAYAYTYTDWNEIFHSEGDNEAFYNTNFERYLQCEQNCMNFASQCLWAGLNGNNYDKDNSKPIGWKNYPMDIEGAENTQTWNIDTASWSSCGNFKTYIKTSGGNTTDTTVRASLYQVASQQDFGSLATSTLKGSVLLLANTTDGAPYHALFVTDASGSARSEVKVCANNPMRQNITVSRCAFSTDAIYVIRPTRFQIAVDSRCSSGHTYPTAYADPTKKGTQCSVCGYYDLRLVGTMFKPLDVGDTETLEARVNYTCYSIAINVTHPDGTSIWYTANNTDTLTHTYTFAKKGLYTIYMYARDLPETESASFKLSHVFTVRVK